MRALAPLLVLLAPVLAACSGGAEPTAGSADAASRAEDRAVAE